MFTVSVEHHDLFEETNGTDRCRPVPLGSVDLAGEMIAEGLSKAFGKEAIPHIRVKPEILGGLLVRTGDTIYDGSVRRRLEGMRRKMLQAHMPEATASAAEA